ncbi:hypothetical protein HPB51_006594 [Rhipicephalus microplus]|uniref:Uncharacterized protein n=1 Tax=Rhipicephalus microplus TaxID=6941 RepID=A0A9J6E7D3_RHIMP|nr:hypothetical protein HPB51_006594 [Rhipicephalus microplus]
MAAWRPGGSRCQATLFVRRGPKRKKGPGSVLRRRLASFLPPRASASDSVNDRWEMGIHSHLYTIRRRPPSSNSLPKSGGDYVFSAFFRCACSSLPFFPPKVCSCACRGETAACSSVHDVFLSPAGECLSRGGLPVPPEGSTGLWPWRRWPLTVIRRPQLAVAEHSFGPRCFKCAADRGVRQLRYLAASDNAATPSLQKRLQPRPGLTWS